MPQFDIYSNKSLLLIFFFSFLVWYVFFVYIVHTMYKISTLDFVMKRNYDLIKIHSLYLVNKEFKKLVKEIIKKKH